MSWIEPVFDRTSNDVLKVQTYDTIGFKYLSNEQKIEWMNGLKGALNFKDLNRIENNMEFLANLYEIENINFKTNWSYIDISSRLDFQRIVDNLKVLVNRGKALKTTPEIPELPLNFYQKINDLEKILYDLYWVYENESLAFARNDERFKSELYSNDNITVI